jgi:cytoskeletal protein CcmA (bactofilin family)
MTSPNIRFKRSAVAGKRPTKSQLPLGELALNTYDGQLFTQVDTGGVGIGTTVISLTPWKEIFGKGAVFYEHNVGIGSNNPTEKLSVEGDARVSNDLTVGGSLYGNGSNLTGLVKNIISGNGISITNDNSGSYTISFIGDATQGTSSIYTEYSGAAEIRADTEIRGDLEVKDNAEIDGNFQVDGLADFHGDVDMFSDVHVYGKLKVNGELDICNTINADHFVGEGSGITGIVTGITAGAGISITNNSGIYEITATGSGIGTGGGTLTEVDTLESVTDRGNHTTNTVTVGGLNVFGISSFNDKVYVQGPLHAGNTASGSVGTINQVLVSTGIGVTWKNIAGLTNPAPNTGSTEAGAFRETHKYTALPQQRYIFVDYMPDYIDIFVNGVKLTDDEYTADNGNSIYFAEELFNGDTVEIHAYSPVSNWIESINNKDLTILRDNYSFVATQSMTTYDVPHSDGFIDIFVNGVRLNSTEYSSVNDQTIVFNERFYGGERVDIHVYNRYSSLISSSSKMIDIPPSSSSDVGIPGQTAYDDNYLYVCTASNTWKRTVLEDW